MDTTTSTSSSSSNEPAVTPWRTVAMLIGLIATALIAMLSAFALPAIHSEPNDLPLAVSGPGAEQVVQRLENKQPGAFDFTVVADQDAARDRILDRKAYGAITTGDSGAGGVLVASAAGPSVASLLRDLAGGLGEGVEVTDVRPMPEDDPRGAGLSAGALPIAIGGYLGAAVLVMTVRGVWQQAIGAIGFSLVGALALTAMLQYGFGSIDGTFWITVAGALLGLAGACWMILGLRAVLGTPGLGLGALIMILVGNPLSGLSSAPEMLPSGWGALGQLLPPGATGSLLRSLGYFDGAGATRPVLVLGAWLLFGIVCVILGTRRENRRALRSDSSDAPDQSSSDRLPAASTG